LLAYDVLSDALKETPNNVEVRQQLALALARSGATQRANFILTQLRDEGHRDEETLGILGALAQRSLDARRHETGSQPAVEAGAQVLSRGYKLNRGYYSGIMRRHSPC
jgi:hypothetical protein